MEIQLIRNATIKLKFSGKTFLIDPYFADKHSQPSFAGKSKNPTVDLPVPIEEILKDVDYVLVSHLHPDHFDEKAQNVLPKSTKIYCQPSELEAIRSIGFTEAEAIGESLQICSTEITRTNGQHGSGSILNFMGQVSGFVFKNPSEKTLYWIGDSIWYKEIRENIDQYKPEIIFCHAGGNMFLKGINLFGEPFQEDSGSLVMDKDQVLELCQYANSSKIVATHLNSLDHETVSRKELINYLSLNGVNKEQYFVPEDGSFLEF